MWFTFEPLTVPIEFLFANKRCTFQADFFRLKDVVWHLKTSGLLRKKSQLVKIKGKTQKNLNLKFSFNFKTLWFFFKDGNQLSQDYRVLWVLILSILERWKIESTLEWPGGFEHGTITYF